MTSLRNIASVIEKYVGVGAALCIVLLMVIVCVDIVTRKASIPVAGIFELVEFSLVVIVFAGLAWTESRGANIKMTAITSLLGDNKRYLLEAFGLTLCLLVTLLLAFSGIDGTRTAWRVGETMPGLVGYPAWVAKAVMALGAFLLCIRFGVNIRNQITLLRGRREDTI